MLSFAIISFLAFINFILAQNVSTTTKFGKLNVDLNIDGNRFAIEFEPELTAPGTVASKLCNENVQMLNITEDTLSNCTSSITNYLQNSVSNWINDKTLRVPLQMGGFTFDVAFYPEIESSNAVADALCKNNAERLFLTAENITNCVNPVSDYLRNSVSSWIADKTLETVLVINDLSFDINFLPERQSSTNFAAQLCARNARILNVTEETFNGCVEPVNEFLKSAINQWTVSKTLNVRVNINNEPVTITFMPERTSAVAVARTFCNRASEALGNAEEDLLTNCLVPINQLLMKSINEWYQSKQIVVSLDVNSKTEKLQFMPERQNPLTVARKFCSSRAQEYGLTEQNVISDCINPVSKLLRNEIQAWLASKQIDTATATNTVPPSVEVETTTVEVDTPALA